MIRFLLGVNLLLTALLLSGAMLFVGVGAWSAHLTRQELIVVRHELYEIELRHCTLIRQIHREGLWRRLGMPGQPWLQCRTTGKGL
mgnify:FL=1